MARHPAFQAGALAAFLDHPEIWKAESSQALPPQALPTQGQGQGGAEPPGRFRQQAQAETRGEGLGVVVEQIKRATSLQQHRHTRTLASEITPLRPQGVGGGGLPAGNEMEFSHRSYARYHCH